MIKITCKTTHEGSEIVADLLYDYSRSGVVVEDAGDLAELWNSTLVWDYVEESVLNRPKEVTVIAYYDGDYSEISEELQSRIELLKKECPFVCPLHLTVSEVKQEDWTENWKKFYKIIEVGDLQVVPVWKKEEATGEKVVLINPGSAFGTGEHESTRLCLSLMRELDLSGKNVIDTGCGSGILGIAALQSGAKQCLFRDIDESALNNLRENLALNQVDAKVECASLLEGITEKADVVFANITADILSKMKNAGEVVKKGGYLVMSGIIDKYELPLLELYQNMGFRLIKRETDGIWVGLLMQKA
ncbi:MAG TPA: hypothetical protein DIC18_00430 [Clostridiales bacterium]|nr:hypothetical protein [Clostridiales bacterium]